MSMKSCPVPCPDQRAPGLQAIFEASERAQSMLDDYGGKWTYSAARFEAITRVSPGSPLGRTLCDIAAQELSAEHLFKGPHLNAKIQQTKKTVKRQCGGKASRPNLPRASVEVMEAWFCVHQDKPYPSEEEKRALAMQLNLKEEQVSNWFVNVRKRFWRLKEGKQTGARYAKWTSNMGKNMGARETCNSTKGVDARIEH